MGTGQNIKALRKRDQLTQEEFAAVIGVSKETVCRWEKDRYAIRRSTLFKIVSKFNLQLDDLTSETAGLAAKLDHEERKGESREVTTDSLCDVFKIQMNGAERDLNKPEQPRFPHPYSRNIAGASLFKWIRPPCPNAIRLDLISSWIPV